MLRLWSPAFALSIALGVSTHIAAQTDQGSPRTGRVVGHAIDAIGRGISAVRITVLGGDQEQEVIAHTVGDAEGMFVCARLPVNDTGSLRLRAEAEGYCPAVHYLHLTAAAPETYRRLQLWAAGTLEVRAVDETGRAIPNVAVLATRQHDSITDLEPGAPGNCDVAGELTLDTVPLGAVEVRAWVPGHNPATRTLWLSDESEVELVLARAEAIDLDIRLEGLTADTAATIHIQSYANGRYFPLPGFATRHATTADVYRLTAPPGLEYRISVDSRDFLSTPYQILIGPGTDSSTAAFALQRRRTRSLRVMVRDVHGDALRGEFVVCSSVGEGRVAMGRTDDQGRVELNCSLATGREAVLDLPSERWTLMQTKTAGMRSNGRVEYMGRHEFLFDPDHEVVLQAIPAVTLAGRVVDRAGRPLRDRRVMLQVEATHLDSEWFMVGATHSLADGRFVLTDVFPLDGNLRLAVETGSSVSCESIDLAYRTRIDDVVLIGAPLATIEGRVRDPSGRPLAGARVMHWELHSWAHGSSQSGSHVYTDREGRYRCLDIEPGNHRIEVFGIGDEPIAVSSDFQLGEGATKTCDFVVQR